jgi:hypothetical protein
MTKVSKLWGKVVDSIKTTSQYLKFTGTQRRFFQVLAVLLVSVLTLLAPIAQVGFNPAGATETGFQFSAAYAQTQESAQADDEIGAKSVTEFTGETLNAAEGTPTPNLQSGSQNSLVGEVPYDLPTNWLEFKETIQVVQSVATQSIRLGNVLQDYDLKSLNYWVNQNAPRVFTNTPVYARQDLPLALSQLDQTALKTAWPVQTFDATQGARLSFGTAMEIPNLIVNQADAQYSFPNIQGMTKLGNYFYLYSVISQYTPEGVWIGSTDSAVIFRLDAQVIEMEAQDGLGIARVFQQANGVPNWNKISYEVFARYAPYMLVSAPFSLEGSHGGPISTDGANIWVAIDSKISGSSARNVSMLKFSPDLQLQKRFTFQLNHSKTPKNTFTFSSFAFVEPGHFYAYTDFGGYAFIEGWISDYTNTVAARLLPNILTQKIGPYLQNMAYNPANKRLYLAADGVIASFPPSLLSDPKPNWRSVQYSVLNTLRESEGIAFDADGHIMYLLVLHSPAIFRSFVYDYAAFEYDVAMGERSDDIIWMMDNHFAVGTLENGVTTFRPDQPVTRGAMAEFLYNISGRPHYEPTKKEASKFKDISKLQPNRRHAIYWLAKTKITTGCNKKGDKFCPTNPVNRGSMAQFLMRMSKVKVSATKTSQFPDVFTGKAQTITYVSPTGSVTQSKVNAVPADRVAAINWLFSTQITVGSQTTPAGQITFRPQDAVNRGSMAQFLKRWKLNPAIPHPTL